MLRLGTSLGCLSCSASVLTAAVPPSPPFPHPQGHLKNFREDVQELNTKILQAALALHEKVGRRRAARSSCAAKAATSSRQRAEYLITARFPGATHLRTRPQPH